MAYRWSGNEFLAWLADNYPPKAEQQKQQKRSRIAQNRCPARAATWKQSKFACKNNSAIQNVDAQSDEDLQQILSELDSLEQGVANPMPQNQ